MEPNESTLFFFLFFFVMTFFGQSNENISWGGVTSELYSRSLSLYINVPYTPFLVDNDLIASLYFVWKYSRKFDAKDYEFLLRFRRTVCISEPIISAEKYPSTEWRFLLIRVVEKTDFLKYDELRF